MHVFLKNIFDQNTKQKKQQKGKYVAYKQTRGDENNFVKKYLAGKIDN
jgi:hypothetical protein